MIEPIDPKTGRKMPLRPLVPDEGFANNPGKSVWGGMVDGKLAAGKNLTQYAGLKGAEDYRLPAAKKLKNLPAAPELLPDLADLKADGMSHRKAMRFYFEKFQEAFGLGDAEAKAFNIAGEPAIISSRLVVGKGGRVKITKGNRGQYIPLFKDAILDPDEIWLTPMKDETGKTILRRRHLKFWRGDGENLAGFGVMEIDGGVWNGISVYDVQAGQQRGSGENLLDGPNGYRRGVLLHRKK